MKKLILKLTQVAVVFFCFAGSAVFSQQTASINELTDIVVPNYHYDYVPDFTFEEVDARIQKMDLEMPFELNDRIFSFIQYFTVRNRDYVKMVLGRKEQYFPMYEETMRKQGMPTEIQYLSIIESGLDPKIKSRVGAMGLWQFMPATGRMYGMQISTAVDDRMDPEKSTEAAAKYLKALYKMFGNWEVALAAYNCGPGNVRKAIRRSGGKKTFWGIYNYLPKETRGYVPQFQAMLYVLNHLEEHNLHLEEPSYPLEYESINFDRALSFNKLEQFTGICAEDLEKLNPSIKRGLVPEANRSMAIRIPKTKAFFIKENLVWLSDSLGADPVPAMTISPLTASLRSEVQNGSRLAYKVKSGDVLGKIASKYGVTLTQLRDWNNLNGNLIKIGQTLVIYTGSQQGSGSSNSQTLAQNAGESPTPKTYTVKPGDSLWIISQKHALSIDQLKRLNNLNSTTIKPGQRLIIG
uniref:LysM peptidoglycan-binding domain-containing protein n=1 Tax=Algoriphagus sp. TaxID=1872435 RepID=UPI004047D30B